MHKRCTLRNLICAFHILYEPTCLGIFGGSGRPRWVGRWWTYALSDETVRGILWMREVLYLGRTVRRRLAKNGGTARWFISREA